MRPNKGLSEAFLDPKTTPKSRWNWCSRGYFFATLLEPSIKRLSERIRSPFLRFMRLLEVVKVLIFLAKINDVEGSALILSLLLIPLFGSLGKSKNLLKWVPNRPRKGIKFSFGWKGLLSSLQVRFWLENYSPGRPQIGSKIFLKL